MSIAQFLDMVFIDQKRAMTSEKVFIKENVIKVSQDQLSISIVNFCSEFNFCYYPQGTLATNKKWR